MKLNVEFQKPHLAGERSVLLLFSTCPGVRHTSVAGIAVVEGVAVVAGVESISSRPLQVAKPLLLTRKPM